MSLSAAYAATLPRTQQHVRSTAVCGCRRAGVRSYQRWVSIGMKGRARASAGVLRRASRVEETIFALVKAIGVRDHYTGEHSRRLSEYALAIGDRMGVRGEELVGLYSGA